MSVISSTLGLPGDRWATYLACLSSTLGHADRIIPFKNYLTALLLLGEGKSVEALAARLAPAAAKRLHQSLHHFVTEAPWSDSALLAEVRNGVLPVMEKKDPISAWFVEEMMIPINNESGGMLHPFVTMDVPGGVMLQIRNGTVQNFIDLMQRTALDRPIVDQTEMADRYDFSLRWKPGNDQFTGSYHWTPSPSENPLPDLFTAIQDQLGLKLESSEADIDVLVIDHVEKPLME